MSSTANASYVWEISIAQGESTADRVGWSRALDSSLM